MTENRNNPLREWDGRSDISPARYRRSIAQYKATRRAVLDQLAAASDEAPASRIVQLGREFAEAFNELDGTLNPFINTDERQDLFDALRCDRRRGRGEARPHL